MPESTWDATIGVNLKGTLNVSRAGMGHMLRQSPLPNGDRGWVVNISSIYGQTAAANNGRTLNQPKQVHKQQFSLDTQEHIARPSTAFSE